MSTRPDAINKYILTYLKEFKVDIIELGVQSLDNNVLKLSGRGHTAEDVYLASKAFILSIVLNSSLILLIVSSVNSLSIFSDILSSL